MVLNMSQVEKLETVLNCFNGGYTVVVIGFKQTELYNVKLHSEEMLLKALKSAVKVRLI